MNSTAIYLILSIAVIVKCNVIGPISSSNSDYSSSASMVNSEHWNRYWGKPTLSLVPYDHQSSGTMLAFPGGGYTSDDTYVPTYQEKYGVQMLQNYILNSGTYSQWLRSASEADIVRFLRARKGDVNAAWNMIWSHSLWRQNPVSGPETITPAEVNTFENSPLNNEIYWAGSAHDGSPVLVFRSALHKSGAVDTTYYSRYTL